jgi:UDP-N-acetylmuramoylalanine--D-glutamate ligase
MLTVKDLSRIQVGIVGFGKEGQAVARFLQKHKITAVIFDTKTRADLGEELVQLWEQAGFRFELRQPLSGLSSCSVLFRSPGVPRLSPAIVDAESHGVVITSQTKWFFDHCQAPIVGVTGTKGKGTTVSLIAHILRQAITAQVKTRLPGPDGQVYVTGNIGKDDPLDLLEKLGTDDVVVFELSSFQLQDLTVSPHVAVCLMVTQEHLDHHRDLAEYHAAKAAIAAYQRPGDVVFFETDYPASRAIGVQGKGKKFELSREHAVSAGVWAEGERVHVVGVGEDGVIDVARRLLRGAHNLENIAAAAGVGALAGVPRGVMEQAIVSFPGLAHRLEFVGTYGNVSFYNDSISTVPESTMAAIRAFSEPLVVILGGSEKGSDFTEMGKAIATAGNIRGVVVIGQMTERIVTALTDAHFSGAMQTGASSMTEVFDQVATIARPGDVVLLSPACASFGMFKNYADRGDQFREAAAKFGGVA